jgi:hypothetical protein
MKSEILFVIIPIDRHRKRVLNHQVTTGEHTSEGWLSTSCVGEKDGKISHCTIASSTDGKISFASIPLFSLSVQYPQ